MKFFTRVTHKTTLTSKTFAAAVVFIMMNFAFFSPQSSVGQVNVPSTGNNAVSCGASTFVLRDHAGTGDYGNNVNGYTVLNNGNQPITINISGSFNTEANYDYITIFRGVGTGGAIIFGPTSGVGNINVTSNSGEALTVRFTSDGSVIRSGFDLNVTYNSMGYEVAAESAAITSAANCSNGSIPVGGGAYKDVTINGSTFYNWVAPASFPGNANQIRIRPLDGSGTIVTLNAGQSSNGWNANGTTTVRVSTNRSSCTWVTAANGGSSILTYRHTQPTGGSVTINGSASPPAICVGAALDLNSSGWSHAGSYSWSGPNSYSNGTLNPPSFNTSTTAQGGTYTITANNNGCTNTASRAITVNANPTASISGTNTICAGGSSTFTASGGTSYAWSTGASTAAITVSSNGTYTVTVTNAAGCTATASRTLTVNANPTASISGTNTICAGGSSTFTASGGTSYAWSTGASTAAITVSSNGTYTVTVTNAAGCTATASRTLTVNANPTASISGTNTICAGGSSTFTASGGTSYAWSTGASTAAITVSSNGTYTVTVTNAAGCTATASRTLTVNANPTPSISGTNTICAGGSSTFTASGGTSYSWSTGASTAAITVSSNGTYTVTVTNAAGCTATASRTLTVNANPTASISGTNTICAGGSSTFTASGGTSYAWSTGASTAAISVSTAGTYTVTVTNAAGCTATASRTLTVNANPTASISGTNTICAGGSSTFTASGGTSYAWSTGASTAAITVSSNGTYTVTVTNAAGCTATASRTLTVNANPTASISGTNTICAGGSSTFTASGGTSYAWSTGASTAAISVSTAGTYTVTVTNAAGCTATASRVLTVNANPTASISGTNTICAGGSSTFTASGGTSYAWSTGASTAAITVSSNGTYTVTVTNAAGCTATASRTLTVNANPTASISGTNTICAGGSSTFTASGGTSYAWSTGASTAAITVSTAGPYTVTVTNAAGCTATASRTLTVNADPELSAPAAASICVGGSSSFTSSLTGGTGTQTPVWEYSSNGSSGWATVADGTPANATYANTGTATLGVSGNIAAGTYYYRRNLANTGVGCNATSTNGVLTVVALPSAQTIVPSIASGSTVCLNQTISATFSGGSGGTGTVTDVYEYSTNSGGNWNAYTPGDLIPTPTVGTDIIRIRVSRTATGAGCTTSSYNTGMWSVANQPSLPVLASSVPSDPNAGICQGDVVSATITPGSGGDSASYDEYEYSIDGGSNWATYTSASNITTTSATGSVQVRVRRMSSGSGCSSTSDSTIANWPVAVPTVGGSVTGGNATMCAESSTGTMTLGGHTGSVVQWQYQIDGGGWNDIAHAGVTYSESPNTDGTYEYRAEVKSGACNAAYSAATTLVVSAKVGASLSSNASRCSGEAYAPPYTPSGGTGTHTYLLEAEIPYTSGNWVPVADTLGYTAQIFNNNPSADLQYGYRFTHSASGSGCGSATSLARVLTVLAPPTLLPALDQCASTFSGGEWDYVYLTASSIHGVDAVRDVTTGNESNKVFPTTGETFKIYRIPMDTIQVFEVEDGSSRHCKVTLTGFSTSTALPTTLPRTSGTGVDSSKCYLRELNDWAHFKPAGNSGEVIASIHDNGIDLGRVTVHSYKEAASVEITPAIKYCPVDKQAAMRRHFTISSSEYPNGADFAGNANALVRLYFTQSDFDDLSAASKANNYGMCTGNDDIDTLQNLYVTKYTGANEDGDFGNNDYQNGVFRVFYKDNSTLTVSENGFDTVFNMLTPTSNHFVEMSVTQFSEFWLHGGSGGDPLPVEMLYIEAKNISNEYISVRWATASEINNHKFEVERSEDGISFSKIGEVQGNGTTTERKDYSYNDKTAQQGIRYYYRLKQIDFDETYEYSPIVSEMLKGEDLFTVSEFVPNPATDQGKLFIKTGKEQEIAIEMHNYIGQVVKEGVTYLNKGSNTINVDFNDLAAGTYTTRIVAGNKVIVRRVVIAR